MAQGQVEVELDATESSQQRTLWRLLRLPRWPSGYWPNASSQVKSSPANGWPLSRERRQLLSRALEFWTSEHDYPSSA